MRETFKDFKPGDILTAADINLLNRVARAWAGMGPGPNLHSAGGAQIGNIPFVQRILIITRVLHEWDDDDIESDESSYSSSSPSSASISESSSSSSSSGSQSSSEAIPVIYEVQPRYFDFSDRTWKTNEDEGPYNFDASDLGFGYAGKLEVDDIVFGWWDQQRGMFVGGPLSPAAEETSVTFYKGKTNASHAKGASGVIKIYSGVKGSETDTGERITAHNTFASLGSNKWCIIAWVDGGWDLIAGEC